MRRPMIFHTAPGDCGCAPFPVTFPSGEPCAPAGCDPFLNDKYLTLTEGPLLKMLGVASEGKTLQFLSSPNVMSDAILVMKPTGEQKATNSPKIPLTIKNPLDTGAYPPTGSFSFIMVAESDNSWKFLHAPTTGIYALQTTGGNFVLVDASSIPGINAIGAAAFVPKANVLGLVAVSPGVYQAKKIDVVHQRALVGDIDIDGVKGYQSLPDGIPLFHPLGKFTDLKFRGFSGLDSSGDPISGGFAQGIAYGTGALTDGVLLMYYPGTKLLKLAPARTCIADFDASDGTSTAAPASFSMMPGGRCVLPSTPFNYPTVRLWAHLEFVANEGIEIAFFRDGVLISNQGNRNNLEMSAVFIDTNVPAGAHVYDMRWKRNAGVVSPSATFRYSALEAMTVV